MDKPQEQQPKRNDLKTLMVLGVTFLALTFGSVAGLCGGFFYYAFSVEDVLQINTVYYPHPHLWENDRKRKKR